MDAAIYSQKQSDWPELAHKTKCWAGICVAGPLSSLAELTFCCYVCRLRGKMNYAAEGRQCENKKHVRSGICLDLSFISAACICHLYLLFTAVVRLCHLYLSFIYVACICRYLLFVSVICICRLYLSFVPVVFICRSYLAFV